MEHFISTGNHKSDSRAMPDGSLRSNGCPACGSGLKRVHRNFGERVLSIVSPRFRYRCRSFFCGWEGCLTRER
jgi:hypothetical protein